MKRTIKGKVYDTATAEAVYTIKREAPGSRSPYLNAPERWYGFGVFALYRTSKGAWFEGCSYSYTVNGRSADYIAALSDAELEEFWSEVDEVNDYLSSKGEAA